jgi:hypothetical protein
MRYGSVCSGIEAAMKSCPKCNEVKLVADFHKSAKGKHGVASWCKKCTNSILREKRKRTYSAETKRKHQFKTRYGITVEQWDEMFLSQGGVCAICKQEMRRPCVDHSHTTGDVRGLLCHPCNVKLYAVEDEQYLHAATEYLGKYK